MYLIMEYFYHIILLRLQFYDSIVYGCKILNEFAFANFNPFSSMQIGGVHSLLNINNFVFMSQKIEFRIFLEPS